MTHGNTMLRLFAPVPQLLQLAMVSAITCSMAHAQSLQPLTDQEMSAITGQEGVMLSLNYYYNSDPATNGGPGSHCSTPDGGGSLGNMDCRFAMQIENRDNEWLVYKNGYASLVLNQLALEASFLGEADSAGSGYDSFFNITKFQDRPGGSAQCLLEGECNVDTIRNTPALRTSYPRGGNLSYDPDTGISSGYNDARFGMYFEGLAIEYNLLDGNSIIIAEGWERNEQGSFMGLNIADNNGPQAQISFGGNFYMYGF